MPLTLAHPAAVLPFKRTGLPLSALIIGSIVPDFEYLLHLSPRSEFSHTALGLLTFCLPVGLLALWIFQKIWKEPLVATMLEGLDDQLKPFSFGPLPHFALLCIEILIGALTHVLWDSFTHEYGWAVQNMESLSQTVSMPSGIEAPLYKILHFASSVLGFAVILFFALHHRTWTLHTFSHGWRLIAVVGWMSMAGAVALGMLAAGDVSNTAGLKRWFGCALVIGGLVTLLVTTFLCLLWHLKHRKPRPSE